MSKNARWKSMPEKVVKMVINPDGHTLAEHEKKSKYGSIKTMVNGIVFDSKKEANYYAGLLLLIKGNEVVDIKRQVKFPYTITYTKEPYEWFYSDKSVYTSLTKSGFYRADFVVKYADGHCEVVDVKGMRTAEYKRKKKIVEELYGIKIIEK